MSMDIRKALKISQAGMQVQSARLNVVAQNIANADSVSQTRGGAPYRRKTIIFENVLNRELGVETVRVKKVGVDRSEFIKRYLPNHPAADGDGYVSFPNVNGTIEKQDLLEAQRAYEANLSAIEVTKSMISRTIDLLRQ